jgi:hypothetical protein
LHPRALEPLLLLATEPRTTASAADALGASRASVVRWLADARRAGARSAPVLRAPGVRQPVARAAGTLLSPSPTPYARAGSQVQAPRGDMTAPGDQPISKIRGIDFCWAGLWSIG